ncbi:hypothetical protein ACRALDRAFT_1062355, partial [Sodiomyces alcalophilus JCM 7366]|uniref:uncharacterized protein n=1 Tax=Sodiomyces alcalophilus JCM 7366 TaxID=591952 RepID=UPI0039B57BFC
VATIIVIDYIGTGYSPIHVIPGEPFPTSCFLVARNSRKLKSVVNLAIRSSFIVAIKGPNLSAPLAAARYTHLRSASFTI